MKCKGTVKTKTKNGKSIKKRCNNELKKQAIFCEICGEPTAALSTDLSAKQVFDKVWKKFRKIKSQYYPFAIFILFTSFLAIIISVLFRNTLAESLNTSTYVFMNLILLLLVPFTLIPFGMKENFFEHPFTIKKYFKTLNLYPKYFLLTLLNIIYFFLLKIICTGFMLGVIVDPILHLVRFVLVLYWITIMFPMLLLVYRKKVNPVKAAIMCYKASAETRWQQSLIMFQVLIVNLIGLVFLGVGLIVSLPFSYVLIERYYQKLDDYELFGKTN